MKLNLDMYISKYFIHKFVSISFGHPVVLTSHEKQLHLSFPIAFLKTFPTILCSNQWGGDKIATLGES